jgi:hypothetical protein
LTKTNEPAEVGPLGMTFVMHETTETSGQTFYAPLANGTYLEP